MATTKATYAKLRDGSWGIRIEGRVAAGEAVTVVKRDGTTKTETVARIIWQGDGVSLCKIGNASRTPRRSGLAPNGRVCPQCGSRSCAKAYDPRDLCEDD